MYKKPLLLLTLLFAIIITSFAQFPGSKGVQNMNLGHFYGKIVDASGKPLDGASVQLVQSKMDTVLKKRKDVIIAGMLTDKKGEFSLESLPVLATFKLKITAIGYKDIEQKVFFDVNAGAAGSGDYSSLINGVDKDLGNITLETDAKQLEGVTVIADKPLLTMGIDRKIFNVEKNLTSVGGTAQDVMKNVPGVNVDIDGNVTMRNATPQIFVDGRPTTMTLDQIPADEIESVEIITNPSAKFDASGGGAGILNVVLKKNKKAGYNGNVRASIDSRARPNFGGNINIKQGKINFFASGALGFRKSVTTSSTTRTDISSKDTAHLFQNDGPVNDGIFAFARMGVDYLIDNRNTITLAGNIARGHFKNTDDIFINRDTAYVDNTIPFSDMGKRNSSTTSNFRNYGATLSFKHNFAKANKDITADLNYNYSKNDNTNDYITQYFFSNNNPEYAPQYERGISGGSSKFFTAQTDYENPISKTMKVEMGARAAYRDFSSNSYTYYRDTADITKYNIVSLLSNNYTFKDQVYAAYLTFSQQIKKFSYQAGLRAESSKYDGTLIDSANHSFSNKYPLNLFPSLFMTYKLTDKESIQLNYSRKINRPNFFQFIPFINFTDSLNLTKGNPNLVPEFTDLYELNYQKQFDNSNSFLATTYFRNTNNLIANYQYEAANPNPLKADSVLITSYANASRSYTYGLELIGKNKFVDWWDITSDFNLFNSTINAGNLPGGQNSSQTSWFAKMSNNFKLPKNYSIQLSGDYQAKTIVPPGNSNSGGGPGRGGGMFGNQQQASANGYTNPVYGADIAIKKDFMKNNAASLTLQWSDIFRTRVYSTHYEGLNYVQDNMRRRDPQQVRLNFSWRFGKMDISLFKRKDMKNEQESIQSGVQGASGQ